MATFTGQAGTNNSFTGTSGADTFLWAAADLDKLDKAAGGGGIDLLKLTSAGALAPTALTGISGIERFQLAAGGNGITLLNGNFTSVAGAKILVKGGAGNDIVDASALTGKNAVDVTAGGGTDILRGGAGRDVFRFAAANLVDDTIRGGGGRDLLLLTSGGTLGSNALLLMSGVETIQLAAAGNGLTLLDANYANVAGARIVVTGGAGGDTVDASALTGKNAIDVTAGAGLDVLKGGAGNDIFRFKAANLTGPDLVQGGGGRDLLLLTSGGALGADALAGVNGVEQIRFAAGGNAITLTNANYTGVAGARILVEGGNLGSNTVDASGLTGKNAIDVTAGTGFDTMIGGSGNDVFRYSAGQLNGNTVVGGDGFDQLVLTGSGVMGLTALANMHGVEEIRLSPFGSDLVLLDANFAGVAGGKIIMIGNAGSDSITWSSLTSGHAVDYTAGSGVDELRAGAGNDTFRYDPAYLSGDRIRGGDGIDTLMLTRAGVLAANALAQVYGVEKIALSSGGNGITLTDANFAGVAGSRITITGGAGADIVDGSALTGDNSIRVIAGGGLDSLTGGAGNDRFEFKAADLAGDQISGGGGTNFLVLTSAGTLAANALGQMTGVEEVVLAKGGNGITLTDFNFTGVTGAINVTGDQGNDTVDASALTGSNAITVFAGGGIDTLKGGAGDDVFTFDSLPVAGDTVSGGAGYDTLILVAAGALATDALSHVTGIDQIDLAAGGNALTLTDANFTDPVNSSQIGILGSAGTSTVDASGLSGKNGVKFQDGGGVETILGGNGTDELGFLLGRTFSAGDSFDGGAGEDGIVYDSSMTMLGSSIKNVEELVSSAATDTTITISGENAAGFLAFGGIQTNGVTETFNVMLSADSTTDLSHLKLIFPDMKDAINVAATSGVTAVVLSSSIASFTGSADSDSVILAGGAHYFSGAVIDGGGGDDLILFDGAAKTLEGGAGSDTLLLRSGETVDLSGVNGDTMVGTTHVFDFENIDASYSAAAVTLYGRNDLASLLIGTNAGDHIYAGNSGATITGGLGADTLSGGAGDDRFHISSTAEAQGDTINGSGGTNGIDVLGDTDLSGATISNIQTLFLAAADSTGTYTADPLTATVTGTQAAGLIDVFGNGYFPDSTETLVVNANATTLNLSNLAFSYWSGDDHVVINGTSGADTITGTSQNDVITGRLGADTLTGGAGADSFLWNDKAEGGDTITDYTRGSDKLVFSAAAFQVVGVFDNIQLTNETHPIDISSVDLFEIIGHFDSASAVRTVLDAQATSVDHGMFILVYDSSNQQHLYYTSHVGAGVADNAVFEIVHSLGQDFNTNDIVLV